MKPSPQVKRLCEAVDAKPVVIAQRSVDYHVCPHCNQEIHEKHTYTDESGVEYHRDCGKPIKFPETPLEEIPAWLRPSVEKVRALRAAGKPVF
jgi:hypothetical protein